jgi:cold shock CspA family protein
MAPTGKQVAVDAAAVHLLAQGVYARITNRDATNSVFLGGKTVTAAAGYELKAGESIEYDAHNDTLYGICAAAKTARVDVLTSRRSYAG